ncbi:peptide deformylase [Streptococcus moroccensis]|uniref:Peptide deformylase n=1 Tax=Streptococcus moroccensis TaxID=1451356 RepID=A0ABT9YRW6_9STRE|nr:peptide deformylase [Streptococcus moroccensis]MDQ0221855.1 peptide deformylase [Streptococcus moroccensis]
MIREIVKDTFFLQQSSQEASKEDMTIGQDLLDTVQANKDRCVGLAANMIGQQKRIIVVSLGFVDLLMFNPVIVEQSGPYKTEESCLSLEGSRPTKRYQTIKVTYLDQNWRRKSVVLKDFPAQICQHEIDHCDGIVI